MSSPNDLLHDIVAISRAVTAGDYAGAQTIVDSHQNVGDIILAFSWLVSASVNRLAVLEEVSTEEMWLHLIRVIDNTSDES